MSDSSGDEDSTVTTDIYIPINPVSKKPLRWDGNDATIIGKLEETWKHYTRKGIFQELIAHRAAPMRNGKLAIETEDSIYFVLDMAQDTRTLLTMCPPLADRIARKPRQHDPNQAARPQTASAVWRAKGAHTLHPCLYQPSGVTTLVPHVSRV